MADIADRADEQIEERTSDRIAEASRAAAAMEQGEPGDCDGCGDESPRLVRGLCAKCREKAERLRKITGSA